MKARKKKTQNLPRAVSKDEMNLLEYCIFSATNRIDRKSKSLIFEDTVYGRGDLRGRKIKRKLTIAFSAEYGRPTARDDLVLLAMMKASRDQGFESQQVYFTRYELLKTLRWPDNGQSYERIDQAFNRIIGTHLIWDNAFWDKAEQSWVDRKFNLIQDANLYDREKYDRARAVKGEARPKSWFKWSEVMFASFQVGYLKSVDLDQLHQINSGVGKRLYRWLDKHFNNKNRSLPIEIPLKKLARQKLGFQPAPASHLRRMVEPAIEELESLGLVSRDTSRFVGKGNDSVVRFRPATGRRVGGLTTQTAKQTTTSSKSNLSPLASKLIEHGVSEPSAIRLSKDKPDVCELQVEHLEWLIETGWEPKKGEGAWLSSAIRNEFKPPSQFKTKKQRQSETQQRKRKVTEVENKRKATRRKQERIDDSRAARVAKYLAKLDDHTRSQLQSDAIRLGSSFLRTRMDELERGGDDQMASVYREQLLSNHVESILDNSKP